MLKKVFRNELEEGMRFSAPVFFDDGENMLVSRGAPIKARELNALDRWKISFVLTAGVPVSEETLFDKKEEEFASLDEVEELDEIEEISDGDEGVAVDDELLYEESPKVDSLSYTSEQILKLPEVLVNDELYRAYYELISSLDEVFDEINEKKDIKTRSTDQIVNGLVTLVNNNRTDIVGFILGGDVQEMELAKSSVNVAILSIIIASHLGLPRHRVLQIATGALLHDVGMIKIPDSIISKESALDETETQQMRSHTFYGYKMIVNELLYADEVGKAAVQHHERWDGDGYPGRLAGQNIDIGARIISVADAFEAMVSPKAYRNSMVGYKAMRNLLADNARRFDPDIIKAMIQSMGIYPVGSIVLMNNSSIARVIESHKEAPLRPIIRILIDEFAKPYTLNEGELVNLMENRTLFIARAIDPAEYQKRP